VIPPGAYPMIIIKVMVMVMVKAMITVPHDYPQAHF
jgi:hypothetical protein